MSIQEFMSTYEQQAQDFLDKTKTTITVVKDANQKCPGWGECKAYRYKVNGRIADISHNHGIKYKITLANGKRSYTFDFWSSLKDSYETFILKSWQDRMTIADNEPIKSAKKPTAYGVLASISGDIGQHDLTFEEFCSEFGYSSDSISAEKTYNAICDSSRELTRLFTEEQLDLLREIN